MLLELFSIETLLQSNRSPRELMQIQEIEIFIDFTIRMYL